MKLPSAASGHFPLLFVLTEFIFASGSAQSHSKNIPIAEQTNHELPVPVFLSPYIFLNRLLTGVSLFLTHTIAPHGMQGYYEESCCCTVC